MCHVLSLDHISIAYISYVIEFQLVEDVPSPVIKFLIKYFYLCLYDILCKVVAQLTPLIFILFLIAGQFLWCVCVCVVFCFFLNQFKHLFLPSLVY